MFSKIAALIAEKAAIPVNSIRPDSDFSMLDSLEFLEFVMELEERFGRKIPEEKVEALRTVGDLAKLLEERC